MTRVKVLGLFELHHHVEEALHPLMGQHLTEQESGRGGGGGDDRGGDGDDQAPITSGSNPFTVPYVRNMIQICGVQDNTFDKRCTTARIMNPVP